MKLSKVRGYAPEYPEKNGKLTVAARLGTVAAAAVLAGTLVGCRTVQGGSLKTDVPASDPVGYPGETHSSAGGFMSDPSGDPSEHPVLDGDVAVDPTEICTGDPELMGNVLVDPGMGGPHYKGVIALDPAETEQPIPMGTSAPDTTESWLEYMGEPAIDATEIVPDDPDEQP